MRRGLLRLRAEKNRAEHKRAGRERAGRRRACLPRDLFDETMAVDSAMANRNPAGAENPRGFPPLASSKNQASVPSLVAARPCTSHTRPFRIVPRFWDDTAWEARRVEETPAHLGWEGGGQSRRNTAGMPIHLHRFSLDTSLPDDFAAEYGGVLHSPPVGAAGASSRRGWSPLCGLQFLLLRISRREETAPCSFQTFVARAEALHCADARSHGGAEARRTGGGLKQGGGGRYRGKKEGGKHRSAVTGGCRGE